MVDKKVTAAPLNANNSHHVRLFRQDLEGTLQDEVGLILCDAQAEENFRSLDVVYTPQESLKTSSGATEHSDFEPPYSSLELDDWSMGRGYSDNSKQKNAYLDGMNMFTVKENILFACGEAQAATFGGSGAVMQYAKVDYRLNKTTHDDPVNIGVAQKIDLQPRIWTYGTMFKADSDYTKLTHFHMKMRPPNVVEPYPMLDLTLEIWTAVDDPEDTAPPWTGPPFDDCWKPGTLVATLDMPLMSWDEVISDVNNMIVWSTDTPFDLVLDDPYFVTLTPKDSYNEGQCNPWEVPTFNGNVLQHAPIITKAETGHPWIQYEDTCATRKCWKFYIDNVGITFDHRQDYGESTLSYTFFDNADLGMACKFEVPTDMGDVNSMVINMWHSAVLDWDNFNDLRCIIYEAISTGEDCTIPDITKVVAELTYTKPLEPPDSPSELHFFKDIQTVFSLVSGQEYFLAILATHQSIDVPTWELKVYPGTPYTDNANLAKTFNDGAYWSGATYPCSDDYMFRFYFTREYIKFDHRLTSGYGGESITWYKRLLLYETFRYDIYYRYGLGAIFKSDNDYTNCIDLHIDMTPWMIDPSVHMPPLMLRIYKTKVEALCLVPDLANEITGQFESKGMTMTADSLAGIEHGVANEIVWEVPLDDGTPKVRVSFDLVDTQTYFITILPDDSATGGLLYREPNRWWIDTYDANMTDPAPMVWKEFSSDDWLQIDPDNCETNRRMWKFYIVGGPQKFKAHFAEINRCLHTGIQYLDGTAGEIYINGVLGLGQFRKYDVETQTGKFLPKDALPFSYKNQIFRILEGPGERVVAIKDWARIIAGSLSPIYLSNQVNQKNDDYSSYSKYAIQNSLVFTKLDVTITQPITHMLGAMGALYVSFGELLNVHRLRYEFDYTTGATTKEWIDEQYWADMMAQQVRAGNNYIWRIRSLMSQIIPANTVNLRDKTIDDVLDFSIETEIYVGNTEYQINSYAIYGDDPHLWIMKEDKPYEIVAEDVYEFRNSQMSSMVDARNGRAAIQHDTFLHFSFHDGVQRWHSGGDLLNHGPDIIGPAGLPRKRQGSFAAFAGYGDMLIGAYDAGEDGYSSILAWNGLGWTELYRSAQIGQRILNCYIQSMDGTPVDWLWFSVGSTIMRLPIDTNPLYLIDDEYYYYPFTTNAHIDSTWISLGLKDVPKYINKFKIIATKAPSLYDIPYYAQEVPEPYEPLTDPETGELLEGVAFAWRTDVSEGFTYHETDGKKVHQIGEFEINAPVEEEAQLIQYRVEIKQGQNRYPIVITDIVMDSIVRLPHKSEIRIQFRLKDQDTDRLNQPDPYTMIEKYNLLEKYSSQAAPVWAQIDAKFVGERKYFVDQGSLQVVDKLKDHNIEIWVMSLVLREA